jgi:hypothetical protein
VAHLHGILATRSPTAILIKRGPGKQIATIGWNRRDDSFTVGQWLRKLVDHRDCDLSADGKHFLFYVNDHSWSRANHAYRGISLAPWLKALAFWGCSPRDFGPGTGLFFQGPDGVTRLRASDRKPDRDALGIEVVRDFPTNGRWAAMVKDSLHFIRLQRDGWDAITAWERLPEGAHRIVLDKPLWFGWKLRQTCWCGMPREHNRGVAWQTFALVSPTGEVDDRPTWEWADVDLERSRVVWSEACTLRGAELEGDGLPEGRVLLDTTSMSFEPRIAPY